MKYLLFPIILNLSLTFSSFAEDAPAKVQSDSNLSKNLDYREIIEQFRTDFFAQFLDNEYSPIRTDEDLLNLRFYTPDPVYRITGKFEAASEKAPVKMITTTGEVAPFVRYAWFKFEHENSLHKLAVYKRDYDGPEFFFIPFTDLTNGDSTYDAGRYLGFKLEDVKHGRVILDFNKAYNPWCHYDERLACPLPPRENSLQIAIRAGEKKYVKEKKDS